MISLLAYGTDSGSNFVFRHSSVITNLLASAVAQWE